MHIRPRNEEREQQFFHSRKHKWNRKLVRQQNSQNETEILGEEIRNRFHQLQMLLHLQLGKKMPHGCRCGSGTEGSAQQRWIWGSSWGVKSMVCCAHRVLEGSIEEKAREGQSYWSLRHWYWLMLRTLTPTRRRRRANLKEIDKNDPFLFLFVKMGLLLKKFVYGTHWKPKVMNLLFYDKRCFGLFGPQTKKEWSGYYSSLLIFIIPLNPFHTIPFLCYNTPRNHA